MVTGLLCVIGVALVVMAVYTAVAWGCVRGTPGRRTFTLAITGIALVLVGMWYALPEPTLSRVVVDAPDVRQPTETPLLPPSQIVTTEVGNIPRACELSFHEGFREAEMMYQHIPPSTLSEMPKYEPIPTPAPTPVQHSRRTDGTIVVRVRFPEASTNSIATRAWISRHADGYSDCYVLRTDKVIPGFRVGFTEDPHFRNGDTPGFIVDNISPRDYAMRRGRDIKVANVPRTQVVLVFNHRGSTPPGEYVITLTPTSPLHVHRDSSSGGRPASLSFAEEAW